MFGVSKLTLHSLLRKTSLLNLLAGRIRQSCLANSEELRKNSSEFCAANFQRASIGSGVILYTAGRLYSTDGRFVQQFDCHLGFVAPDLPTFFVYLGGASPVKWAAIVLVNAVLKGKTFTCSADEETDDGSCPLDTGEDVLELYNMKFASLTIRIFTSG